MERAPFVRIKRFFAGMSALALAACTGSGAPEAALPDSAMVQVQTDPVAAPRPIQAESLTPAPARTSATSPTRPAQRTETEPKLQPPPPRDTRPSIPWPPDTL
ncbi:hypothetical protein BH23GEM1_BH23GEM1_01090 [soil metagenome]